jgi:hypothetical protein
MWCYPGVDALVGTADEGIPFFELWIEAPVASGPIGMFPKETNASWYKKLHRSTLRFCRLPSAWTGFR